MENMGVIYKDGEVNITNIKEDQEDQEDGCIWTPKLINWSTAVFGTLAVVCLLVSVVLV